MSAHSSRLRYIIRHFGGTPVAIALPRRPASATVPVRNNTSALRAKNGASE